VEHRCGARYVVDVPVYVRAQDGLPSGFGRLRELSASGGFIETRLDVQPLSRVAVQLLTSWHPPSEPVASEAVASEPPTSNAPPSPLIVEAEVVRLGLHGLYLEWTEYAADLVRCLTEHPQGERLSETSPLSARSKDGVPAVLGPLAESIGLLELRD